MHRSTLSDKQRKLNPPSRVSKTIYGILAILVILIPEKLAEWAIIIINLKSVKQLPKKAALWQKNPELRLAEMSLSQLRQLAMELTLAGYSSENKRGLTRRLLMRSKGNLRKKWKD